MSHILVVMSNSGFTQKVADHCSRSEYQMHCTHDPLLALKLIKTEPVHLILFEYRNNDRAITTLLQNLSDDYPQTPIIVLTQPKTPNDVLTLLRLGATDVFDLSSICFKDLELSIERQIKRVLLSQENLDYRQQLEQAHQQVEASLAELRHDQQDGYRVQQSLMPPQDCQVNGLHIQRIMKSSLYLSGDFVDHICIDPYQTLVYLADVSGHGSSSAFLTVLLKNITNRLVRQHMQQSNSPQLLPAKVLDQINRELMEFNQGKHITIFMGLVDLQQNRLHYCVGGHLPMPILSCRGDSYYLPGLGSSLPLGLFEDAIYSDLTANLEDDFNLIVCSDGVLEILPHDKLPEKELQLLKYVRQTQTSTTETVSSQLHYLCNQLQLQQLDHVPDDIALLSIKRDSTDG
jgi:sigma-B regulation protein RsbU (phosphoserine phosphatase)